MQTVQCIEKDSPSTIHITSKMNGHDSELIELKRSKLFKGYQLSYSHYSHCTKCVMKFSIYIPPQAENGKVPLIYFLAGWRCDHNTFQERSGMQLYASQHGFAVVTPDTSPRFSADESEELRSGHSASFYLNATEEKFRENFQMYSYITVEFPELVIRHFPVLPDRQSIMGHSMGGHGALISFLKNPGKFRCVSVFSPPCNPTEGRLANMVMKKFLGDNPEAWKEYDSTELMKKYTGPKVEILFDQGLADRYYKDNTLQPEKFESACQQNGYPLMINFREGYGHSFYFISSFVENHFQHHSLFLKA